jgi:hypothetical protein
VIIPCITGDRLFQGDHHDDHHHRHRRHRYHQRMNYYMGIEQAALPPEEQGS